jgi:glycosyltransferase involved in cell wall biosynthesis
MSTHCIYGLNLGGAEILLRDYAKFCSLNAKELKIINLNAEANELEKEFPPNVVVHETRDITGNIVICHMFPALLITFMRILFFQWSKKSIFFHQHNEKITEPIRKLILFLTRSLRKGDILFSESHRKWYNSKNIIILKNFIKQDGLIKKQYKSPPASKVVKYVYVGRLVDQKNIPKLLSTKLIEDEYLHIYGDGPYNQLVCNAARSSTKIFFHGVTSGVRSKLCDYDALVLTSFFEGFPIVCLEAALCGIPIICPNVGSIREDFKNTSYDYDSYFSKDQSERQKILNTLSSDCKKMLPLYEKLYSVENFHHSLSAILND